VVVTDTPNRAVRILVAHPNALLRRGLRSLLHQHDAFVVTAEATHADETVRLTYKLWPEQLDLILIDRHLPEMAGVPTEARLQAEQPSLPVVMFDVVLTPKGHYAGLCLGTQGRFTELLTETEFVQTLQALARASSLQGGNGVGACRPPPQPKRHE
jgi:DNA-binding NarL/FixJ family response regulator